jgi:hypothetical protein
MQKKTTRPSKTEIFFDFFLADNAKPCQDFYDGQKTAPRERPAGRERNVD